MVNIPPVNLKKVEYRFDMVVLTKPDPVYGGLARKVVIPAQSKSLIRYLKSVGWKTNGDSTNIRNECYSEGETK